MHNNRQSSKTSEKNGVKAGVKSLKSKNKSKVSLFRQFWEELPSKITEKHHEDMNQFSEKWKNVKIQAKPLKMRINMRMDKDITQQHKSKTLFQEKIKVRASSQSSHTSDIKSKVLWKQKQKQKVMEEQKKAERLKQINKRKQELMDRLKKIDAQIAEAKKEESLSPINQSLLQSKLQKSSLRNSTLSKMSPNKNDAAYNINQHKKAVQMLDRITNEKMKRQEKIAEELKKKQISQLQKITEMEKRKQKDLQNRKKRELRQLPIPKNFGKNQNLRLKLNSSALQKNTSVMPTTMQKNQNKREKTLEQSFEEGQFEKFERQRMETEKQEIPNGVKTQDKINELQPNQNQTKEKEQYEEEEFQDIRSKEQVESEKKEEIDSKQMYLENEFQHIQQESLNQDYIEN